METGQEGWRGSLRVAVVYIAGIVVGGLGAGIAEQTQLIGSSPGTYALLTAHLGTFLNYFMYDMNHSSPYTLGRICFQIPILICHFL